ncbi:SpoIIIAH-like family protein [Clostridium oryzae]|uniref:SpoIIIAH-like protein n=1 Tax=Clostridium oryzae TaxID=1450648 RepID=A0A1V4ITV1_9CLOT|nr:SpoIIIAH-like family protein [Clostridium oryzae]OPJ63204.1 SpoIIIAH-like protein [Clostridium oryzae]
MNKKQAGIIVTLLALIVCMGILATRVNGPLQLTNDEFKDSSNKLTFNNEKKTTVKSTSNFFKTQQTLKDNSNNQTLASLKSIMSEKTVSKKSRDDAEKKYTQLALAINNESRIEQILKANKFSDVLCFIENNYTKARVIVKAKQVSAQQLKQIKDVVNSVANINNVEVQMRE